MAMSSRVRNWMTCDGSGALVETDPRPTVRPTRRGFLVGLGLGSLAWAIPQTALSQISIDPNSKRNGKTVVVSIFLRGGADGLNVVVPHAEDAYHRNRPSLRLLRPNEGTSKDRSIDLDGFFGFHPALTPLLPLYQSRQLAVVHAAGSFDQTRSHFEAMNTMERGLAAGSEGASSGWLARFLQQSAPRKASPLRAIAFGGTMPDSLRGATDAIAINSLEDFRIASPDAEEVQNALAEIYAGGTDAMSLAGHETLQVLDTLNSLDPRNYKASNGSVYPKSDLGQALQQVALLIRADVGLELAVLDKGGWDTHVAQGSSTGLLNGNLEDLGAALAALARDLAGEMSRVTVVVQTEFGRRLHENSGLGTDHGRASFMFVLGGGVNGGKVYAAWPGLEDHQLEPPGDLRVTTDYRAVLSEVLGHSFAMDGSHIFEGYQPQRLGLYS